MASHSLTSPSLASSFISCDIRLSILSNVKSLEFPLRIIMLSTCSCPQVFFVDYGNSEWTPENFVKRMLPHFLHLPFQAVECFLGNVVPKEDAKENGQKYEWSKEAL